MIIGGKEKVEEKNRVGEEGEMRGEGRGQWAGGRGYVPRCGVASEGPPWHEEQVADGAVHGESPPEGPRVVTVEGQSAARAVQQLG